MSNYKQLIQAEAKRLGFAYCGFSKADFLEEEAPRLEKWLNENRHGEMRFMEEHFDKRLDPRLLVDGAKTVISLMLNYYTDKKQNPTAPKISMYAYGKDYHRVIGKKLKNLLSFIRSEIGEVNGRSFVDIAPVMDKAWAAKSGLGWIGKNANLINKKNGSFYFLAELIIDLELEPDKPTADHCGSCTKCIDACPTEAIIQPYVVDGSKCISYFTIELKDAIPTSMKGQLEDWMFGCDVCQNVCPWNRFSVLHQEQGFTPKKGLLEMNDKDWDALTEETFKKVFSGSSPVKRAQFSGLKRNIDFLK